MTTETITHNTLKHLAEAGAVHSASAVAIGDRWAIVVAYGGTKRTLRATNSHQVRSWASLNSLVKYLMGLGIRQFNGDATHYDPQQKTISRPDKSATLKRAHEAAAHDQWFREKVQESLDDPRPGIPHDEAMQRVEAKLVETYGSRPKA